MTERNQRYQRLASASIVLASISISFIHALYSSDSNSWANNLAFAFLVFSIPLLVFSWIGLTYHQRRLNYGKKTHFPPKELGVFFMYGFISSIIGIIVFLISWSNYLAWVFGASMALVIWQHPICVLQRKTERRAKNLKKIRKARLLNTDHKKPDQAG